jgi:hypothetical protein
MLPILAHHRTAMGFGWEPRLLVEAGIILTLVREML